MIPQKLQIKNFLSYGPILQTIDFSLYSLICLSGKNGHGKSALLDAMTWALWGQARKVSGTAKADQGLLRLGQTQMLVVFDFIFGGKQYRIRREYMETYGKPVTVLEFGMIDPASDEYIPLTDKTIRATQEKIEQTLRLDFESFSNSAFLRQGSSNEFSKKSPKDRKQILATILGLDQYEVLRKLAMEKIKDAHGKKTVLTTLQEKRTQELAAQELLNIELINLNKEMISLSTTEQKLDSAQITLIHNRSIYDEKQREYHNLSFQLQQFAEQALTQKKQVSDLLLQWRAINKKKQSLHNINHLEQTKNKTIVAIAQHQKLFQDNLEHQQKLLTLTQRLNVIEQQHKEEQTKKNHALLLERERLIAEQKNSETILFNNEQQIKQYSAESSALIAQIAVHEKTLSGIVLKSDEMSKAETHFEKRKSAYQHFVSLGNWISSELNSLSNKKKLVHDDDPSCPLCEQNLSASRRRFLKGNFEKQESALAHRLQRLKRIIPTLKEILIEQHTDITSDKEQAQKATYLTEKIKELTIANTKIVAHISDLTATAMQQESINAEHKKTIVNKQKEIEAQSPAIQKITDQAYYELLQQKQTLEKQLQKHVYNEANYKKDQKQLKEIELQLANHHAMQKDIAQQENRKEEINNLCNALKELKSKVHKIENERTALGELAAQLHALQEAEKNIMLQKTALKNQKEILLQTKGSIENQHKHLIKIREEFQKEQVNIAQLHAIIDDYQTIATATGKDGIQALLIEEAIPEIEQEANFLLSRLTNNQAQIFIESLRDLKKGGTKETLDIKISDQTGIRPYELFSGGEAFRIDFALRIAISKLLARRAGTALQTLIIDEGFGSQDEEGLGHIMDALHKIQDDFSKIIIVSHLHTMKDQFPVQFCIEKGVQGSTVTVIEQG